MGRGRCVSLFRHYGRRNELQEDPSGDGRFRKLKKSVRKKVGLTVGAAVCGCMMVLIAIVLRAPAKPEAEIVFLQVEKVLKEPNRFQRWVEALRSKLVKQPTVGIMAEIFTSDMLRSMENAAELIGSKPLSEKDGVQVWIRNYFDDLNRSSNPLMLGRKF